jgi:hypothetical protein
MSKLPSFPKWKAPKGKKRPPTDDELDGLIAAREAWAAARVVGWEKHGLQAEDYDFSSWVNAVPTGVENGHFGLRLGACYEYARESRKLRGLLLLLNPDRKREWWENGHNLWAQSSNPDSLKVGNYSFEGVTEAKVKENGLYELIDALSLLAEPLAANLSFADVWRTNRGLVMRALKHGDFLYQMRVRHGITSHWKLGRGAPVEFAWAEEQKVATTADTMAWGENKPKKKDWRSAIPARQIIDGKEVILIRVDLENYRNEQLKAGFDEILKRLRRSSKGDSTVPPEPEPEKKGKKATVLTGDLSKLRAMRLLQHSLNIAQAVREARRFGNKFLSDENLYRDAKAGRAEFKKCFPFEEEPYHGMTPSQIAGSLV